jgi:hypothetical protein
VQKYRLASENIPEVNKHYKSDTIEFFHEVTYLILKLHGSNIIILSFFANGGVGERLNNLPKFMNLKVNTQLYKDCTFLLHSKLRRKRVCEGCFRAG